MEMMAFKSTHRRDQADVAHAVEAMGGMASANSSREQARRRASKWLLLLLLLL